MVDVFKTFSRYSSASKDVAKERLKLILINDRANIPPQFISMIRGDLIKVMSDYAEIDEDGIEIIFSNAETSVRGDYGPSLVASIPIKKVKSIGK